jgi:hypothetical protein
MKDELERKKNLPDGSWIATGMAIGAGLGAAMDNIGAGIS